VIKSEPQNIEPQNSRTGRSEPQNREKRTVEPGEANRRRVRSEPQNRRISNVEPQKGQKANCRTMERPSAEVKYDLEERLIIFAVRVIRLAESLPKTPVGRHILCQLTRSGTSPAPNYGEAQSA
jgi:hypothetical protein